MEGASLLAKRQFDLAISMAWHTEAFARTKRLPKLDSMLGQQGKPKSAASQVHAFVHALRVKGVPVEVTRTPPRKR